jgi:hypothetical protein
MKNPAKILVVAGALTAASMAVFMASTAMAQCGTCSNSSAGTDVYARVVVPIHLCAEEEINFGAFCAPASGSGTATIQPDHASGSTDGGLLSTSGITSITQAGLSNDPFDGDGPEEARFLVTGEPGLTYTIVSSSTGMNKIVGVATPLTIGNFSYAYGGAAPQTVGLLPATGAQELNVGARIAIPAGQPSGWYHGTVHMTTTYN